MVNRPCRPCLARRSYRPLRPRRALWNALPARWSARRTVAAQAIASLLLAACASNPSRARGDGATGSDTTSVASLDAHSFPGPDATSCLTADISLQNGNAAALFDATKVPVFDLFLPQAEWEALQVHAREEEYVPARACYEGRGLGTVGLRFKGSYGSLYECFDAKGTMICPRLGMKIKFDEYATEQRFFGLKRLNFNAYLHDDSRMKEKLAYDLFRAMGIVTPRSAWAVVRVNGQSLGLFGMVEQVDGRFTADRWADNRDGNLYKELWPTHASDQQITDALETNREAADISAYRAFSQAVMTADDASLLPTLGKYMDIDYLARFLAVEDAIASYDGITYFWTDGKESTNHNYFIYEESPNRFTMIPWDAEATFWINPNHAAPHWTEIPTDCSITYPYWNGLAYAPGCDLVFRALNKDLGRWRAAARELLDGPFSLPTMVASIDRYIQHIKDAAHADPTPSKYAPFDSAVGYLRTSLPGLRERLEQLIAVPEGDGGAE